MDLKNGQILWKCSNILPSILYEMDDTYLKNILYLIKYL